MRRLREITLTIGLLCGLASGFVLANLTYRSYNEKKLWGGGAELTGLSATSSRANPQSPPQPSAADQLTADELRQAVIRADLNRDNLPLQRNLGLALFRYAVLEDKKDLLPDAVRLLERADKRIVGRDRELFQTLGDAWFMLASIEAPEKMSRARQNYRKALEKTAQDAALHFKIGQTYFYEKPSNPTAAINEYSQALKLKPASEEVLESLARSQIALDKLVEAETTLKALNQLNPQNKVAKDLQVQLIQRRVTAVK